MSTTTTVRIQSTQTDYTETLFVSDCGACGVVFGMPQALEKRRRDDGKAFYCPNGHTLVFTKSEISKQRERANRLEEKAAWLTSRLDQARAEAEHERRRAAAARGQLTKMRNRVANGCCPKVGCTRSFTSIADHVRTEHPELIAAINEDASA